MSCGWSKAWQNAGKYSSFLWFHENLLQYPNVTLSPWSWIHPPPLCSYLFNSAGPSSCHFLLLKLRQVCLYPPLSVPTFWLWLWKWNSVWMIISGSTPCRYLPLLDQWESLIQSVNPVVPPHSSQSISQRDTEPNKAVILKDCWHILSAVSFF